MPLSILTHAQIAQKADECLRSVHWDGAVPVPIEQIIDVRFGIDLVPTADLEASFGAMAFITRDLKEIRVDDFIYRRQPYRLAFSLAHELAHLLLHRDFYESLTFTTPQQWKRAMLAIPLVEYRRMEWQADMFAGLLLVPPSHFQQAFKQVAQALHAQNLQFTRLDEEAQDYAVMGWARTYGVSKGTIWHRLRDERLI